MCLSLGGLISKTGEGREFSHSGPEAAPPVQQAPAGPEGTYNRPNVQASSTLRPWHLTEASQKEKREPWDQNYPGFPKVGGSNHTSSGSGLLPAKAQGREGRAGRAAGSGTPGGHHLASEGRPRLQKAFQVRQSAAWLKRWSRTPLDRGAGGKRD